MKIGIDISTRDAVLLFKLVSHECKTCACTPGSVFPCAGHEERPVTPGSLSTAEEGEMPPLMRGALS